MGLVVGRRPGEGPSAVTGPPPGVPRGEESFCRSHRRGRTGAPGLGSPLEQAQSPAGKDLPGADRRPEPSRPGSHQARKVGVDWPRVLLKCRSK